MCLALIFLLQLKNGVQNMYRNERVSRSVYNSSLSRNRLFMRHDGRREYTVRLQDISEALIADGYTSLDAQAKALGVHRSTAWTIMKAKHKLGRLSLKTTNGMLANPETPPAVRAPCREISRRTASIAAISAPFSSLRRPLHIRRAQ